MGLPMTETTIETYVDATISVTYNLERDVFTLIVSIEGEMSYLVDIPHGNDFTEFMEYFIQQFTGLKNTMQSNGIIIIDEQKLFLDAVDKLDAVLISLLTS